MKRAARPRSVAPCLWYVYIYAGFQDALFAVEVKKCISASGKACLMGLKAKQYPPVAFQNPAAGIFHHSQCQQQLPRHLDFESIQINESPLPTNRSKSEFLKKGSQTISLLLKSGTTSRSAATISGCRY